MGQIQIVHQDIDVLFLRSSEHWIPKLQSIDHGAGRNKGIQPDRMGRQFARGDSGRSFVDRCIFLSVYGDQIVPCQAQEALNDSRLPFE